jgi:hypothetical protein
MDKWIMISAAKGSGVELIINELEVMKTWKVFKLLK